MDNIDSDACSLCVYFDGMCVNKYSESNKLSVWIQRCRITKKQILFKTIFITLMNVVRGHIP